MVVTVAFERRKKGFPSAARSGRAGVQCADELSFQKIIWGDHNPADPSPSCGKAQSEKKIIAGISDTPMEGICPPGTGG